MQTVTLAFVGGTSEQPRISTTPTTVYCIISHAKQRVRMLLAALCCPNCLLAGLQVGGGEGKAYVVKPDCFTLFRGLRLRFQHVCSDVLYLNSPARVNLSSDGWERADVARRRRATPYSLLSSPSPALMLTTKPKEL